MLNTQKPEDIVYLSYLLGRVMENRQHFRVSDFLPVEVYDGEKRVFPRSRLRPTSIVQGKHEDILNAVLRSLRKAKATKKLSTDGLKAILSLELADVYMRTEEEPNLATTDPRRCHVSVSEGGIRVDMLEHDYDPEHTTFLTLVLHLPGDNKPLCLNAHVRGSNRIVSDGLVLLRFEFSGMSEHARQRLFRYILKLQSQKVRTTTTPNNEPQAVKKQAL
ncbi:MAG: PilZ domain [Marinobacter excellens HL-55]|uniref:PilZ domain n=1 Tax=Marinobacter excellens HL-55 TaxID=1305731 RepID=A0A0N8KKV2_9GAMM|nr:MAG: PilZ domain [Marinobacter excellens HL-55]